MFAKQSGFAMLEVLISMTLVAIVFLSLLSYQIALTNHLNQSRLKAIAHTQLINFVDMLRVNQRDRYRQKALREWNKENDALLPNARGQFSQLDEHECRVVLHWFFHQQQSEAVNVWC